ncbi:protein kinase C and casein kinase substrate in neurons protein 2-like, partial [Plectropomus leopardus]|uniref:protein kinase C and casein kinase substrate in neurons protein 2-like n=1 Tax=Plectropomus leopardus TaxID=160734 RepID=UPI001C4C3F73
MSFGHFIYNSIKNSSLLKNTAALVEIMLGCLYTRVQISGILIVTSLLPFSQTKERYEKSLEELDKLTPQYMENMEQVFEQWQQFEDKRIRFFRELLLEVKQHLDLSTNHRFQTIYHTLEDTISATDAEDDLKWFRSNHGPGMPMNWPQFE